MSNCVAELDGLLQSMQELKPPGVSGPKIQAITSLCTANIKDETVLIQKVYAHFKKAPNNKKLGVLYVVDSVSRQWLEQARKSGQTMGSGAADGTFAAGVNHVTELLPSFMSDIIIAAPDEQKVKLKKLVDIWERGNTFPAAMLTGFKQKLEASVNAVRSTTPIGTPPKEHVSAIEPAKPVPDTASILANLQALANLPKPNVAPGQSGNPSQGSSASNVSYPQTTIPQGAPPVNAAFSMPSAASAVNTPTPVNGGVISYGLPPNMFPNGPANQGQSQQPLMPQSHQQAGGGDGGLQQQLQILAALKAQGIPEAQWPALLSVLMQSQGSAGGSIAAAAATAASGFSQQPQPQQPMGQNSNAYGGRDDSTRDRNGYDQYMRSPSGRYRDRSRSRSPRRDRYRNGSPQRRGSPTYGDYGDREANRRGNRGNRQRSPNRNQRSPSPRQEDFGPIERFIEFDPSMGEGMIKVLSRTLFVGGVTCSENDLRAIFTNFGRVQTCIVNVDKRHAFVKMITRKEAERAKVEMEHYKTDSMQLRTRWGVGFGPRPCSDYATGISVIPIDRLTDADRKWMLTAEYGGSGGRPIESGLVVEEPDIEIGAGVSSKAISRRMQTDKSGTMGPRSSRDSTRQRDRRQNDRENVNQLPLGGGNQASAAPPVPGFGFPFMQNGLPMIPGPGSSQPPPPGAG